jgi:tryptophanyl-tRNA synthetase
VTDPAKQHRRDPGEPTRCNIYTLHGLYSTKGQVAEIAQGCRQASIGCLECKAIVAREISESLAPIRERRCRIAADPDYVRDVLRDGAQRARPIAEATMMEVKQVAGFIR